MIIHPERIITGDGKTVLMNQAIFADKGYISDIGSIEELSARYPNEQIIRWENSTLLPGLIDLHTHISNYHPLRKFSPFPQAYCNDFMLAYVAQRTANNAFKRGVTTIRDAAGADNVVQTMQFAAGLGYMNLPRIFACDRGICMTGGHSYQIKEGAEEIDGLADLRKAVRRRIKNGCRWIKVMASHRAEIPEFTQEEMNVIGEEAHRLGAKVMVHAGTHIAVQMSINAGYDSIEHGTFMDIEQAYRMIDKGITWTPTIMPYSEHAKKIRAKYGADYKNNVAMDYLCRSSDSYRENFMKIVDTGIIFGAGTDYINDNNESDPWVSKELYYMVECGLEPLKAIKAGTSSGAKILGISDKVGEIKPGFEADLLLVEGNPSDNIEDLENIIQVWRKGESVYCR